MQSDVRETANSLTRAKQLISERERQIQEAKRELAQAQFMIHAGAAHEKDESESV